ncbi:hypothetical protein ACFZCP_45610 [Streptomyces sp. NPDC007971]|uniref:hypothetical protein n=1 Tax=Streptomyces sp. NPDC007971 TaxID=3364799 RepID=UPI0036EC0D4A
MISTRRIVAAVGLAVGVTGLAAPLANAAVAGTGHTGQSAPMATMDPHQAGNVPAQRKSRAPRVALHSGALDKLDELNRLDDLGQVTDLTRS